MVFFQATRSGWLSRPPEGITRALDARLLLVDRRGFGQSEPSAGRALIAWADDVVEILEHFGVERFRVAGVPGGCPYALATAWRWPDRVLASSVCGGSGPVDMPDALSGAAFERLRGMSVGMAKRIRGSQFSVLQGQGHLFVYRPLWREILTDLLGRGARPSLVVTRASPARTARIRG